MEDKENEEDKKPQKKRTEKMSYEYYILCGIASLLYEKKLKQILQGEKDYESKRID
jgi:hypothetical protein